MVILTITILRKLQKKMLKKTVILLVGITSPFQERFLIENKEVLQLINFKIGVGGSFDVIADKVKRAPLWMQKNGFRMVLSFFTRTEKNVEKIFNWKLKIYIFCFQRKTQ